MPEHTFSTGRTVRVTPISPWVLEAVRDSVPEPAPPVQTVETPEGPQDVPNIAHPDYLAALDARTARIGEIQQELIVEEGADFDVDQAAVDKRRATLARLGVALPPKAQEDDRYFYLYYVCMGSTQDRDDLIMLIHGLSVVREEAVAKATESF
jgi:hypothetical protein